MSTPFWRDETKANILKECLSTIINDVNGNVLSKTPNILVFIGLVDRDVSVCMEIYDGNTFKSRKRFSGLPQRTSNDASDKQGDLPPVKKGVADLVDMLLGNSVKFHRVVIQLQKQKRQLLARLRIGRNPVVVRDSEGKIWGYSLQLDPALTNGVFESYVDWLEQGSEGRAPSGEWDGFYRLCKISIP